MNRLIPILLLMFVMIQASAQEELYRNPIYTGGYNPFYISPLTAYPMYENQSAELKKLDVGVELGTSFATNMKRGFAFTTFVAPELRYRLNPRLTIRGGISLANSEYSNTLIYSPYGFAPYNGNITQGLIYVSGDYVLGPRLILSGTAFKEFSIDHSGPEKMFSPGYDGKGLMMNLRFMPTDNVTIDAGIEIYEGNNPYRGGYYNPFYSPFSPRW